MNNIKINELVIIYDFLDETEINHIKNIVNNNYNIICMCLDNIRTISLSKTDREDVIHITNFDNFFKQIITDFFQSESNKEQFANENLLPGLHLEYLIRKKFLEGKSLVEPTVNIDDSTLYSFIAYKYYEKNGTFEEFTEYLKYRENTKQILSWLENNHCFETYNYLLKSTTDFLTSNDFYFLENISKIIFKMFEESFKYMIDQGSKGKIELPQISKIELDNLFIEFLYYINAPKTWFETYQKLKENNLIEFIKTDNEIDDSLCYRDSSDTLRITINTDGTIKGFASLVHEFCHYLEMKKNINTSSFSISEFPSIFFERIAGIFLTNKGYQKEIIYDITNSRKQNNIDIYSKLSPLFLDIAKYWKEGYVSREAKIKFQKEQFRVVRETKQMLMQIEIAAGLNPNPEDYQMPEYDVETLIDEDCQTLITCFVENGLLVLNGYQYIFSTFIAEKTLNMFEEDNTIISKMIMITDDLPNMNLQKILDTLGIKEIFEKDNSTNKDLIKTKKIEQ